MVEIVIKMLILIIYGIGMVFGTFGGEVDRGIFWILVAIFLHLFYAEDCS